MKKKDELILKLLLNAIQKEIDAYNYYIEVSENSPYAETKSLLLQLAGEERKHRQLLLREYRTVREMLKKSKNRASYLSKDKVRYKIPKPLPYKYFSNVAGIEVAGITLPTEFMGGDYLENYSYFEDIPEQRSMGILLCDIMGHGLKASQLKGTIKQTFSELIEAIQEEGKKDSIFDTASLMHRFNKLLWAPCRHADSFITLFYCILHPHNNKLIYTSAGHNPPLLFSNNAKAYVSLSNTQLIIGILENVEYTQQEININKGDILLIYSDGLVEATNKKEEEFGIERLIEIIQLQHKLSSKNIIQHICQSLEAFLQEKPLEDDLTIAVAQIL
jgi:sigma-B regulation protein RsbU (phosphoserine phosphatase)